MSSLVVSECVGVGMALFSTAVAAVTIFFNPPAYGKNLSTAEGKPKEENHFLVKVFGPRVSARLAWILMEAPALFMSLYIFFTQAKADHINMSSLLLLGLFDLHYFFRSMIYPHLIKSAPVPIGAVLMAMLFCSFNGFQQSYSLFVDGPIRSPTSIFSIRSLFGIFLYFSGFLINQHSDYLLRKLRSSSTEKKYQIPYGGFFEYVSAANYFGEIVEWIGFAIAAGTISAASFAYFTFAMLGTRGIGYHQWYLKEFGDKYPKKRKAVIPFIY